MENVKKKLKIILAVHGIGDHVPFTTIQQVASRVTEFNKSRLRIPLGHLHEQIEICKIGWAEIPQLKSVGFSEVFWSDIAKENEHLTIKKIRRWASSLLDQFEYLDSYRSGEDAKKINRDHIERVIDDTIITASILRLLLDRIRVGYNEHLNAAQHFIASFQLFTEFPNIRDQIIERFFSRLEQIEITSKKLNCEIDIHICAHSLGSVITLIGLLQAYHKEPQPEWLRHIKSIATFGSPVDTFFVLWGELFTSKLKQNNEESSFMYSIKWDNYCDSADLIASEMSASRNFLNTNYPGLFEANSPVDYKYSYSKIPGKAHIDYWEDRNVFTHWLSIRVLKKRYDFEVRNSFAIPKLLIFLSTILITIVTGFFGTMWLHINELIDINNHHITPIMTVIVALIVFGSVGLGSSQRSTRKGKWLLIGIFIWIFSNITSITLMVLVIGIDIDVAIFSFSSIFLSIPQVVLDNTTGIARSKSIVLFAIVILLLSLGIGKNYHPESLGQELFVLTSVFAFWWLSHLFWRFFITWSEYIVERTHIDVLCKRWEIQMQKGPFEKDQKLQTGTQQESS